MRAYREAKGFFCTGRGEARRSDQTNTTQRAEWLSEATKKRWRAQEACSCSSDPARWAALMWDESLAAPELMTRDEYSYENDRVIDDL